jgi:O-antigen/teichoic acid export membrane protein
MWHVSAFLFLCDLVRPPAAWVANAILVRGHGGLEQMGIYGVGLDWMTTAMAVPTLITGALLPVTSGLHAAGIPGAFAAFVRRALAAISGVAVAIALGVALLWPAIVALYGTRFDVPFRVLGLLLTSAVLGSISNALRAVAISTGRHAGTFVAYAAYGAVMISIMYVFRSDGAHARAAAQVGADVALLSVLCIVNRWTLRRATAAQCA